MINSHNGYNSGDYNLGPVKGSERQKSKIKTEPREIKKIKKDAVTKEKSPVKSSSSKGSSFFKLKSRSKNMEKAGNVSIAKGLNEAITKVSAESLPKKEKMSDAAIANSVERMVPVLNNENHEFVILNFIEQSGNAPYAEAVLNKALAKVKENHESFVLDFIKNAPDDADPDTLLAQAKEAAEASGAKAPVISSVGELRLNKKGNELIFPLSQALRNKEMIDDEIKSLKRKIPKEEERNEAVGYDPSTGQWRVSDEEFTMKTSSDSNDSEIRKMKSRPLREDWKASEAHLKELVIAKKDADIAFKSAVQSIVDFVDKVELGSIDKSSKASREQKINSLIDELSEKLAVFDEQMINKLASFGKEMNVQKKVKEMNVHNKFATFEKGTTVEKLRDYLGN